MIEVRKVIKSDLEGLKSVLDTLELFPSEMLDEMISGYFTDPESEEIWFTATQHGIPCAIGYCAPEKLTDGTCNLYAIGVQPDVQGKGIGKRMMAFIEDYLRDHGKRLLIVDTSSAPEFDRTRAFYREIGYTHEATIRDFWKEGDDKVTFWKKLA